MVPVGVGKTGWKGVGVGPSAGWKGVAVGGELGSAVTKVSACAAGAGPQAVTVVRIKRKSSSLALRKDAFIRSCHKPKVMEQG
jgi:hypothetical protein